jgi:hypothetical protein
MAAIDTIDLNGMPVDQVYDKLQKVGISKGEASVLVANWILQNAGQTRRTFNYATAFPQADPACTSGFLSVFSHAPWFDGQSVVQAEETTTEQGFNKRFDNIKHDIDNLGVEVAKAFTCLAAMRHDLRLLLDEIRAELNRIDVDLYTCCVGERVVVPNLNQDLVRSIGPKDYLGTTMFFGKAVSVWKTSQGNMLLPLTIGPATDPTEDPRVKRPAALGSFIEETPEVRAIFAGGPVTKQRFIDALGALRTKDGFVVADLVKILPDNQPFATPEAMLAAVTEREAAALRTSGDTTAILTGAFGVGTDVPTVGAVSVEKLEMIPAATRAALVASGVDTVEKLAAANPRELSAQLGRGGATASAGDIGAWSAVAKTLNNLR